MALTNDGHPRVGADTEAELVEERLGAGVAEPHVKDSDRWLVVLRVFELEPF